MADTQSLPVPVDIAAPAPFDPARPVTAMLEAVLIACDHEALPPWVEIDLCRHARRRGEHLTKILRSVARLAVASHQGAGECSLDDIANAFRAVDLLGDVQEAMVMVAERFPERLGESVRLPVDEQLPDSGRKRHHPMQPVTFIVDVIVAAHARKSLPRWVVSHLARHGDGAGDTTAALVRSVARIAGAAHEGGNAASDDLARALHAVDLLADVEAAMRTIAEEFPVLRTER